MTTRIAQPCWIRFQALAPVGFTALFAIALEIPLSSDTRFCMTFSNGGGKRSWNIIHRHKLFFTNLELSTSIHAIQNTMKCTNSVHRFFLVNFSDHSYDVPRCAFAAIYFRNLHPDIFIYGSCYKLFV